MSYLDLVRRDKVLSGKGDEFWLGDVRFIVVHPNSYEGVFQGVPFIDGQHFYLQFERIADSVPGRKEGLYCDVRASSYIKTGIHDFADIIRICHRKNLRDQNEQLWKKRANDLRMLSQRASRVRAGTYEIAMTAHSGPAPSRQLTDDEAARCNEFLWSRLQRVTRTQSVDMTRLKPAVSRLYAMLDMPAPDVVLHAGLREAAEAVNRLSPDCYGALNGVMHEHCFGPMPVFSHGFPLHEGLRHDLLDRENHIRNVIAHHYVGFSWGYTSLNPNDAFCAFVERQFDRHPAQLWFDVFDNCLSCWMHEEFCYVADFPEIVNVNERWILHCDDGPAVRLRDKQALYFLHGMAVSQQVVEAPHTMSPSQILNERSVEIRRLMIDRFGVERLLTEIKAKALQEDECGVLYSVNLPNDEPLTIVKVRNSTPEPDGSHKFYYLRVPAETRTAREGIAWTFGLEPHEYAPTLET